MGRRGRTLACLLGMAGVLALSLATCAAGALAPESEQVMCCKAGHEECGPTFAPADCCKHSSSPDQQFTTTGAISPAPRHLVIVPQLPGSVSTPPQPAWIAGVILHSSSPPGSKHPTYLVLSTLRL